jgi:hypothetical protein
MIDENIDLNGGTSSVTNAEIENEHAFDSVNADLEQQLSGIRSDADLIDAIITMPEGNLIPWEECTLPSRGIYYGWADGTVKVKAMGQMAEKVLATQRLAQSGQSIDYLFRECCKFPEGFDPADMLLGDRTFLLYFLRGITHGNEYEFMLTCPNPDCAVASTHIYDLNNLSRTISWAKDELGPEPFKVVLPYLTKVTGREIWVGIRHLRSFDVNDILNKRKNKKSQYAQPAKKSPFQRKKVDELDDAVTENLEKVIVNIMGVTDSYKIRAFIEKLHAQDTATIREWMKENTPGIDSTIEITCPECGNEFTVELPITSDFFRPSKQR